MNNKISTVNCGYDLSLIQKRVNNGSIFFKEEDKIIDQALATKLITMILLDIKIPRILLLENNVGISEVAVYGKVLFSIIQYMNNKFSINENSLIEGICNKKFEELTNFQKNTILEKVTDFTICLNISKNKKEIEKIASNYKFMYSQFV